MSRNVGKTLAAAAQVAAFKHANPTARVIEPKRRPFVFAGSPRFALMMCEDLRLPGNRLVTRAEDLFGLSEADTLYVETDTAYRHPHHDAVMAEAARQRVQIVAHSLDAHRGVRI